MPGSKVNRGHTSVTKKKLTVRKKEKFHDKFISYHELQEYLIKMATDYSNKMVLEEIGKSKQGKPIYMVIIVDGNLTEPKSEGIMIEAGSNGNEWMSVSTALYIIDHIVKNTHLSLLMDFFIIPCSNPDGYDYSLVCKSAQKDPSIPINLANNFPLTIGLSDNKSMCKTLWLNRVKNYYENLQYNAPETCTLAKTICDFKFAIKLFVSLQCNGQTISYPFGCTNKSPEDAELLLAVANAAKNAAIDKEFQTGSIYDTNGLSLGNVADFIKLYHSSIRFVYMMNLEDRNIEPDSKEILRLGEDILPCIISLIKHVHLYYKTINHGNSDVEIVNEKVKFK